jgi:hypothetical protein
MEKTFFETLSTSLQEAVDIKQGKRQASRLRVMDEPSAKMVLPIRTFSQLSCPMSTIFRLLLRLRKKKSYNYKL